MGEKVDFSRNIFSILAEQEPSSAEPEQLEEQFPLWDILKEIDRRMRRADRDRGPGTREYMNAHPEEVERIKRKHGL